MMLPTITVHTCCRTRRVAGRHNQHHELLFYRKIVMIFEAGMSVNMNRIMTEDAELIMVSLSAKQRMSGSGVGLI